MTTNIDIARRGIMLIVSSPSGAGKTTLTRNLLVEENKEGQRHAVCFRHDPRPPA